MPEGFPPLPDGTINLGHQLSIFVASHRNLVSKATSELIHTVSKNYATRTRTQLPPSTRVAEPETLATAVSRFEREASVLADNIAKPQVLWPRPGATPSESQPSQVVSGSSASQGSRAPSGSTESIHPACVRAIPLSPMAAPGFTPKMLEQLQRMFSNAVNTREAHATGPGPPGPPGDANGNGHFWPKDIGYFDPTKGVGDSLDKRDRERVFETCSVLQTD